MGLRRRETMGRGDTLCHFHESHFRVRFRTDRLTFCLCHLRRQEHVGTTVRAGRREKGGEAFIHGTTARTDRRLATPSSRPFPRPTQTYAVVDLSSTSPEFPKAPLKIVYSTPSAVFESPNLGAPPIWWGQRNPKTATIGGDVVVFPAVSGYLRSFARLIALTFGVLRAFGAD